MRLRLTLPLLAALVATAACDDNSGILPATTPNTVDTVTLSAFRDTNLAVPSGFSVSGNGVSGSGPVFTQDNSTFDFVFNVDDDNVPVFLTTKVLNIVSNTSIRPGFQPSIQHFDSITTAPINNYVSDDTIHAAVGQVWYVRSALVCSSLSSPMYGKLEVLSIDAVGRTITFRTLINLNCGYHSLRVGTPTD